MGRGRQHPGIRSARTVGRVRPFPYREEKKNTHHRPPGAGPPTLHRENVMNDYRNGVVLSVLCPSCGEVDLSSDQVWLVIANSPNRSHYLFRCTTCEQAVSRHADDTVIALLAELVAVEELEIPAEALESHDGPPLTPDDLLDLLLALEEHEATGCAAAGACSAI